MAMDLSTRDGRRRQGERIKTAARDAGLMRVFEFAEVEAAIKVLKSFLKPGDVVLLKASRVSRLERIAEMLKAEK